MTKMKLEDKLRKKLISRKDNMKNLKKSNDKKNLKYETIWMVLD